MSQPVDHDIKLRDITVTDEDGTFVPIPLESIPVDLALPMSIYLRIAGNFVRFRAKGDQISFKRRQSLEAQYSDAVYLTKDDWRGYLEGLEGEVEAIGDPPTYSIEAVTKIRHLLIAYGRQLADGKKCNKETFDKIRDCTAKIALALRSNLEIGNLFVRHSKDPSFYATNHSINVAVYASAIGIKLLMPVKEIQELALACFLHDVGKVYLEKGLLTKTGVLEEREKATLQTHTNEGALLLNSVYPTLPQVELVAAQHHERYDGTGYPHGLEGKEINLFARICKIADVFDFLTSISPSVNVPLDPDSAIQAMKHMKGKFDKQLFGTFESFRKPQVGHPTLLAFASPLERMADANDPRKIK